MESKNQSCEKLVAVEAGLSSSQKPSDSQFIGIPKRHKSPKKCTNCVFILLATLLFATVSWQVWQIVRNEQIMKEIKSQALENNREELMLVQENPKINEMTDKLKNLQNTLTEIQKKIDQQDKILETTELPVITSGQPPISDDVQKHHFDLLFEKMLENVDAAIPINLDAIPTKFPIIEKDISQDEKLDSLVPIRVTEPIDEPTPSVFHWTFSFGFGGKAEEKEEANKSGDSNASASDGLEVPEAASTETESVSSEGGLMSYIPGMLLSPFGKQWTMPWGWMSSDMEESVDSESEEETETDINSEETQSIGITEVPATRSSWTLFWGFDSPELVKNDDSKSEEVTEENISSEETQSIESTEVPATRNSWTLFWGFDSPELAKSEDSKSEENTEKDISSEETQSIESTEVSATRNSWALFGGFDSPGQANNEDSESEEEAEEEASSEEEAEEEASSEESQTVQSTEVPAYDSTYDDLYEDTDTYYKSYEYPYSSGDNFYDNSNYDTEVSTPSSSETLLEELSATESPSTELSSTSTVGEVSHELPATETPAVSSSSESTKLVNFFSDDDNPDGSTDFYGLGSVIDGSSQTLLVGPTPSNEDYENSSISAGEDAEDVATGDSRELNESYFHKLMLRRLLDIGILDALVAANMRDDENIADEFEADSSMYDDNSDPSERSPSIATSREWSYISKRSVDKSSTLERPRSERLSSKQLEQKMAILQQSIDDDNHFLRNEVSLYPEPTKSILQAELNSFNAKMEFISAHIDRLHERFLRLNELDDDYVSKEFPSEDGNADGGWISSH